MTTQQLLKQQEILLSIKKLRCKQMERGELFANNRWKLDAITLNNIVEEGNIELEC